MPEGFLQWQAALLICEIEGMKALNKQRELDGMALGYGEHAFYEVMDKYKAEVDKWLISMKISVDSNATPCLS